MTVDSLSLHEAGTIASNSTHVILDAGLITQEEASVIRPEIENYFKNELVQVRTFDKLIEDERSKWMDASYQIYASHIGADRADQVKLYYANYIAKKKADEAKCKEKKDCCQKK